MPTPAIQTLINDAQQVLNLDSISAVRSVVAVSLANANTGTPLNPNLTTQQLWNEFYQVVPRSKSDIESIIANQLMKFLFAPPAPGGVGANGQVIFNDGGVLAGDPQFLWNKTTNLLTVTGAATITGDLTVDTSTLKVDSTNNRVGIVQATPLYPLHLVGEFGLEEASAGNGSKLRMIGQSTKYNFRLGKQIAVDNAFEITPSTAVGGTTFSNPVYTVTYDGIHTFLDGAGGTRMTLNSTGLGVGVSPTVKLDIAGAIKSTGDITSSGGKFATVASGQTVGLQLDSFVSGGVFNNYILNNASVAGTNATLHFGRLTSILYGFIRSDNNTQNIEIGTAGTARLTIDQSGNIILATPSTPPTLATNGQLTVNATSNTNLRFSYRGSDGTTRVANITLA